MQTNPKYPTDPVKGQEKAEGCATSLGQFLVAALILFAIIITQTATYTFEQVLFIDTHALQDRRWQIGLGYSLSLLIPLALLFVFAKHQRSRAVFRTWMLAALFSLLVTPARTAGLTDAELADTWQIIGMLIFILGSGYWLRSRLFPLNRSGTALAVFLGILLGFPWFLWGAIGSPLDLVLNLTGGLLFGISAAVILQGSLLSDLQEETDRTEATWSNGLIFAVTLAVMATGFGVNGEQWMLAGTVTGLAWAVVILAGLSSPFMSEEKNWLAPAVLIGLAAAWPLIWIDPDELAQIISTGQGELIGWAIRGTLVSLLLALFISLILFLLRFRLAAALQRRLWAGGLALVALVGAAGLYLFFGQPGFFGERLFVVLKQQTDFSTAQKIPDLNQRREFVYQTLVKQADQTQAGLRSQLSRLGFRYKAYYLENGLEVWGGPLLRLLLQNRPEVDRVLSNPELRPLHEALPVARGQNNLGEATPLWNQSMIGADRVWKELGVTGQGVIVGQSDSGVQGNHPELQGSYRGKNGSNDYNWYDPWYGSRSPMDIGGHGTHTLGIILGKQVGIAPGASWIGCTNLARNLGNPSYYLDCMQFMLAPFPQNGDPLHDGDPTRGAMVLNNSWGCPDVEGCDANALLPAVKALRAAGIFVVVSAGNSGDSGCATVTDPPAIYQEVYTVGAIDNQGQRAGFSSVGPVTVDGSNRIKPDIAAPGVDVLSSFPNSTYTIESGTSMAGPHIVGVVALMWSANPKLIGDIDRTTQILNQTARSYRGPLPACASGQGTPNDAVGYGVVDAYAAVKLAQDSH